MIDCQKIKALAEQQLVGTDVFVVSCKVSPSNEVELLLDSDTSVQLETCAAVNRAVNEAMVDDEEDFSLTVASAGIGEELKCERQFRKLVGRPVEVLLLNGTKIRALLDAADARQSHVLRDLDGIRAPRRDHLAPGTDENSVERLLREQIRAAQKPPQAVRLLGRKCRVGLHGVHGTVFPEK